jgi:hypothetical protein
VANRIDKRAASVGGFPTLRRKAASETVEAGPPSNSVEPIMRTGPETGERSATAILLRFAQRLAPGDRFKGKSPVPESEEFSIELAILRRLHEADEETKRRILEATIRIVGH